MSVTVKRIGKQITVSGTQTEVMALLSSAAARVNRNRREELERRLAKLPCMGCAVANVLEPGKCPNPNCCNYPDQEEEEMSYAGEPNAIAGATLDRYERARRTAADQSGLGPAANGRSTRVQELSNHANELGSMVHGLAQEIRELLTRAHLTLDQVVGSVPEPGRAVGPEGMAENGLGPLKSATPAPTLELLATRLHSIGHGVDEVQGTIGRLRDLVNRLEAL